MWFCLGFAIFLGIFAGLRYFSGRAVWRPDVRDGPHGTHIQPIRQGRRRPVLGVRVIVPIADDFAFEFSTEGSTDRIAKALGIAEEWQTGDREFDDAVYISSDDARLCMLLRQDARSRRAVLDLTHGADGGQGLVKWGNPGVYCRGGELWLQYAGQPGMSDAEAWQIAEFAAPRLFALVEGLTRAANGPLRDSRDVFVPRARTFLAVCGALFFGSVLNLVAISAVPLPLLSDRGAMWQHACHFGLVATLALLGAAVWQLGRSARTHRVLLWVLFIGGPSTVGTAYSLFYEANIAFDHGAERQIERRVASLHERRGRGRSFYMHVDDWGPTGGERTVQIPRDLYGALSPGARITLIEHPGALGVPWVGAIERAP